MSPLPRRPSSYARVLTSGIATVALGVLPLLGCTVPAEGGGGHEELDDDALAVEAADGTFVRFSTYYTVTRVAPDAKDGLWVARVNQPDTKCGDGTWASECHVAAIDWSRAGYSTADSAAADAAARAGKALLRGKIDDAVRDGKTVVELQASETWEGDAAGPSAAGAQADAVFVRAFGATACTADPCADVRATRLNKSGQSTATYAAFVAGEARARLGEEIGVMLAGAVTKHGDQLHFTATQSWRRRAASEPESDRSDGPACEPGALADFRPDELRVHLIDVGQGDAIWVQTPWHDKVDESLDVLVDAGPSGLMPSSSPGGAVVVAYMLAAGKHEGDVLDALVVTHAHDDHFGGVARVTESFGVARYVDPGFTGGSDAFLEARAAAKEDVDDHHGHMHVPAVRELVPRVLAATDLFGPKVEARLLWGAEAPPNGNLASTSGPDVNNTSIALSLRWAGRQVLLLGDIESPVEAALVKAHDAGEIDLAASVLKVAHHGSSRSSGAAFLQRVFGAHGGSGGQPGAAGPSAGADAFAVISSGRRSFMGSYLPTDETMERLHAILPERHVLSTEHRDQLKMCGDEHGDDHILVRIDAAGAVRACYLP